MEEERKLRILQKWEEKKKLHPNYDKYKDYESIPLCYQMGYNKVTLDKTILSHISSHCKQSLGENKEKEEVSGLLFGKNTENSELEIKRVSEINYGEPIGMILDENMCKFNMDFLGVYTSGIYPSQKDVELLGNLSRKLDKSLFLLKVTSSGKLDEISIHLFECVFDIGKNNYQERIICIQSYETEVINKTANGNNQENKFFTRYLNYTEIASRQSTHFKIKKNEASSILYDKKATIQTSPTFVENQQKLLNLLKEKKDNLKFNEEENYIQLAEDICQEANIELRYYFVVPEDKEKTIMCGVELLDSPYPIAVGKNMEECINLAAYEFLCSLFKDKNVIKVT